MRSTSRMQVSSVALSDSVSSARAKARTFCREMSSSFQPSASGDVSGCPLSSALSAFTQRRSHQASNKLRTARRTWSVSSDMRGASLLLLGLHFVAHSLAFGHYAQSVFAEDFLDVGIRIAAVEKGLRDFGQVRDVFHADGHIGAIVV